jgi:sugar lactone lactonase YvrE
MLARREFLTLIAAAPVSGKITERRVKVETVYKSPGPKPNGLQATKDGLWILDQGDNHAYLVELATGKVLRDLATDSKAGSGITFDGEALWLASTYSREIIRCDAKTGKTIVKFASPGSGVVAWSQGRTSPLAKAAVAPKAAAGAAAKAKGQRQATGAHGLEWRDGKLWISNPPSQKLYRVEPKNLTIEKEIATPGDRPHGIGWEGKHLWLTDSNHNAFYKLDVETGVYSEKIQLADSDPLPHGMTVWQGWMWYCDDVGVVCRCKL